MSLQIDATVGSAQVLGIQCQNKVIHSSKIYAEYRKNKAYLAEVTIDGVNPLLDATYKAYK